jgi:hypothetical protein
VAVDTPSQSSASPSRHTGTQPIPEAGPALADEEEEDDGDSVAAPTGTKVVSGAPSFPPAAEAPNTSSFTPLSTSQGPDLRITYTRGIIGAGTATG